MTATCETVLTEDRTLIRNVQAPKRVRTFVRWQLLAWGVPGLIDTIELIASELVTNAVQNAAGEIIGVRLECSGGSVLVRVWDDNERDLPQMQEPVSGDAERGRGLAITDTMCEDWGAYRQATGGKVVWAMISGQA
jgi:anti-sigma regulatory factor (Ser/Thr protein kinase)